jgi:hypothetical protein
MNERCDGSFDSLSLAQDIRLAIPSMAKVRLGQHLVEWPAMSERSESNGAEGSRTLDLCIANFLR